MAVVDEERVIRDESGSQRRGSQPAEGVAHYIVSENQVSSFSFLSMFMGPRYIAMHYPIVSLFTHAGESEIER